MADLSVGGHPLTCDVARDHPSIVVRAPDREVLVPSPATRARYRGAGRSSAETHLVGAVPVLECPTAGAEVEVGRVVVASADHGCTDPFPIGAA